MPWFVEVLKGKYKGVRGVIDHESKYYYYIDVNNPRQIGRDPSEDVIVKVKKSNCSKPVWIPDVEEVGLGPIDY